MLTREGEVYLLKKAEEEKAVHAHLNKNQPDWRVLFVRWLRGAQLEAETVIYDEYVSIGTDENSTIRLPAELGANLPDCHLLFTRDRDSNRYTLYPHPALDLLTRFRPGAHTRRYEVAEGPVSLCPGAGGQVEFEGGIALIWRVDPPPPDPSQ